MSSGEEIRLEIVFEEEYVFLSLFVLDNDQISIPNIVEDLLIQNEKQTQQPQEQMSLRKSTRKKVLQFKMTILCFSKSLTLNGGRGYTLTFIRPYNVLTIKSDAVMNEQIKSIKENDI